MNKTQYVLDEGFVTLLDSMGSDIMVSNTARVSFNKYKEEFDSNDEKLINYLAKNKHWTPFAHPQVQFRIKAPIYIRTQLFKSKVGLVENEVSRRYVKSDPEFYTPSDWRSAPIGSIKQGSGDSLDPDRMGRVSESYTRSCRRSVDTYKSLLFDGLAPEVARGVLPQSTYTEWIWTGSLAAFARVYSQRIDPHAQVECQEYAKAIGKFMGDLFPVSWEALTCER